MQQELQPATGGFSFSSPTHTTYVYTRVTHTHTHTHTHSLGSWAWHLGVVPSLFRGTVPPWSYVCLHVYDFLLVLFGGEG